MTVVAAALWGLSSGAMAKAHGNKNYGKADDYGSDRFAMVNHCVVQNITANGKDRVSVEACMNANGFAFCPDCRIFGNRGPKVLTRITCTRGAGKKRGTENMTKLTAQQIDDRVTRVLAPLHRSLDRGEITEAQLEVIARDLAA